MTDLGSRRHKVFYEWWIVGACFLIAFYVGGTINYGFTAVFEPIASEFHWSYAQVSLAASLRGLETGLLAPLVGLLIDRLGARRIVFTGVAVFGLGFLLLNRINSLLTFYGSFILIAAGISTCAGVVPMTVVGKWFQKRVTIATGIVVCGVACGGILVPAVSRIIDIFEWRAAMLIIGLGAWVMLLPLTLLIRKPQHGDSSDGDTGGNLVSGDGLPSLPSTVVDIGVSQALKSRAFWHMAVGLMCHILVTTAVITHVMPYLSTIGIARSTASLVASAIPLTSIAGRLSFGWLGDRFDKRWVTAAGVAIIGLGSLLFGYVATVGTSLTVPFVIFLGIGYGGPIPMTSALVREYFGSVRLGTILGLLMGAMTIGTMTGPLLAGWVYDTFGSYQGAWFAFTGVAIAGAVSLVTAPSAANTMRRAGR